MSKAKLYSGSSASNAIKLPAEVCDCGDGTVCNHSGTATQATGVAYESVSIDGVSYAAVGSATVGGTAAVLTELNAALDAAGYFEIDNLTYTYDGSDWVLSHTGEATIDSITFGGVTTNLTAACLAVTYCDFFLVYGGNAVASTVTFNGADTAFSVAREYGTATTANIVTELEAILPANTVITVIDNGSAWDVTASLPIGSEFAIDDKEAYSQGCYTVYTT